MLRIILLLGFLWYTHVGFSQLTGYQIPFNKDKVEIPFRFENNFILIDIVFNHIFPLTFIFDTGSENTILTHKAFADLLDVDYEREYRILGADLQQEIVVHLAKNVSLDIPTLPSKGVPILVLEENYFQFEKYTGIKIHGILGMDLFKLTIMQIDYKNRRLILHKPNSFQLPSNKFKKFPIEVVRGKIYLDAKGAVTPTKEMPLKLLIDSGANISLLLHHSDSTITLPPKLIPGKLGDGLGGFIEGYMGRASKLQMAPFEFSNITTHFQKVPPTADITNLNNRHGILGNGILRRFNVIIIPYRSEMYLKAEKKYNRGFKYDKSGIALVVSGTYLDRYTIVDVVPNSPAAEAGVQAGDEILSINNWPAKMFSLEAIATKFQKRTNKRYRLKILRDGEKHKITFRLRDLI